MKSPLLRKERRKEGFEPIEAAVWKKEEADSEPGPALPFTKKS